MGDLADHGRRHPAAAPLAGGAELAAAIGRHLAIIGSSNVDIRSFLLNKEVSILFYDAQSIAGLKAVEAGTLAASRPLTLDEWRRRPALAKFLENLARLISPLL